MNEKVYSNCFGESLTLEISERDGCFQAVVRKSNEDNGVFVDLCYGVACTVVFGGLFFVLRPGFKDESVIKQLTIIAAYFVSMLILTIIKRRTTISEESLVQLEAVTGLQYNTRNKLGQSTSTFISSENIIINEVVTGHRVIYCMSIIDGALYATDAASVQKVRVIPVFTKLKPSLEILRIIFSFFNNRKLT